MRAASLFSCLLACNSPPQATQEETERLARMLADLALCGDASACDGAAAAARARCAGGDRNACAELERARRALERK